MAIQAQMYPENLGVPFTGGSQDWLYMSNNNQNIFNNFSNTYNNNNNDNMGCNDFQQEEVLLQLQQQYMVQLQNQQKNTSFGNNNNNNNCASSRTASTTTTTTGSDYYQMPVDLSSSFVDQLEKQRQEIDRFVTLQNERLKLALQEQRKQQLSTIMRKLEAKAMQILTQKDEEIARAKNRSIQLEDIVTKMAIENQEWQRLALENEAMVVSLNNTLENFNNQQACCEALSSTCSSNESCCNVVDNNKEVSSNTNNHKGEQEIISVGLCKVCKSRKSCILLLPCRHLCCCKGCEPFIDACPICKSSRMASIEALIS